MLLLFDLDDTLVRTHPAAYEKTVLAAAEYGRRISFKKFAELYGKMPFEECVKRWFDGIDPGEFRTVYDTFRETNPYAPLGDVRGLLTRLKGRHDIGIITNSTEAGTRFKLRCIGIGEGELAMLYHAGNILARKPDPAQLLAIKEGRADIVYVGDTLRDYRFARNADVPFYGVLTGLEKAEEFLHAGLTPERILPDVHALEERV